ncbi:MAG: DUF3786 domain-containing protein [Desulfosarcina sp.]|nr:DUF3786 domain-containing protein [Desulfobacterales bacterium]
MARVDDYIAARRLAAEKLAREPVEAIIDRTGLSKGEDRTPRLRFLDRTYRIQYPGFEFADIEKPDQDIPLQEQVLILHYMVGADKQRRPGNWVAYREIPGAGFYFPVFVKRAIDPLKGVFGRDLEAFRRCCRRLDGKALEAGDAGFQFQVFPQLALQLILWAADDEFASEANILFSEATGACLSPEDTAWLAGMVVYRLLALNRT